MDNGNLIAGGMDKLAQGFQTFQQNQQTDAVMRGMLGQLVSQGPGALTQLSPGGQQLASKFMEGKANRSDMMQLMGEATASKALLQQQQAAQMNQANINLAQQQGGEAQQRGGLNAAQAAQIQQKMQWLQQAMNPPNAGSAPNMNAVQPGTGMVNAAALAQYAQPVAGTGQPNVQPKGGAVIGPPTPVTMADPQFQPIRAQLLKQNAGDIEATDTALQKIVDAANAQANTSYESKTKATKPTGALYFKRIDYKDGVPQMDVYSPELVTGQGTQAQSLSASTQEIQVAHGSPAPATVVKQGSNVPDNTVAGAGYNTNDPAWQGDVKEAYQQAAASAQALGSSKLLNDAATAYTSGNTGRWNAVRGNPAYASIMQMMTGNNPLNALQIALAANTQGILGQIRSANGSVGGRILQNEYENTAKVLGSGTMDSNAIMMAAQNLNTLNDRRNSIDQAYAKFRETMPAGQAEAMATQMFGGVPNLASGAPPAQSAAPGKPPQLPGGMVRVKTPGGQVVQIPQANLQQAVQRGAIPLQ